MILRPNIKVNLGLDILRKRPDGYHDIETLFLPCNDFRDILEVVPADEPSLLAFDLLSELPNPTQEDSFSIEDSLSIQDAFSVEDSLSIEDSFSVEDAFSVVVSSPVVTQAISEDGKVMITIYRAAGVDWDPLKDLTVKAYRLLEQDFQLPSIKIVLKKLAPVGAGLGGGSADAAYTLIALNEIFDLKLTQEQLAGYAARLGSDCAFFIYNKPMFGSGRGEILSEYPMGDFFDKYTISCSYIDGISVSTAQAYAGVTPSVPEIPLRERLAMPVESWKDCIKNDFEAGVVAMYPQLGELKDELYHEGAIYASMSGSGSAFFAIWPK